MKNNNISQTPKDEPNKFVRFDWAAKRMLRDKANFGVLEGLITVLLGEEIHIVELLESGSQRYPEENLSYRLDMYIKDRQGDIRFVELRIIRLLNYWEQVYYMGKGAITEHISLGNKYDQVKKIYHISILYFDLGQGADYLYHGRNTFVGVHTHDELKVSTKEDNVIRMRTPQEIFPEYYIIRVNEFNRVASTPLEEWIDYLKTGNIRPDTQAPGLNEAREKLQYLAMNKEERQAYDRHISAVMVQNDVLDTAKMEGRAEGRAEERTAIAANLRKMGMTVEQIVAATGLSADEIEDIQS